MGAFPYSPSDSFFYICTSFCKGLCEYNTAGGCGGKNRKSVMKKDKNQVPRRYENMNFGTEHPWAVALTDDNKDEIEEETLGVGGEP